MDSSKNGPENAYDITSTAQWATYTLFRPNYPPSLFQLIYDFHMGEYNTAHDAGCGPGITAAVLSTKFAHVFCSDFSSQAVETARQNLTASATSETRFSFKQSSAEDMSWIPTGSLDLVTMSEALHWTETATTVREVNRTLKPGGTFAAWYYTDAYFPENRAVQAIYDEMLRQWVKLRASWSEQSGRTLWVEHTGYDCVGFPEEDGWQRGLRRVKFNTKGKEAVWQRDKERAWQRFESKVGEHDVVEYVEGAKEWEFDMGVEWFRGWFESMFPVVDAFLLDEAVDRLEKALGGPDRRTRAVWPVVLILVRKEELRSGDSSTLHEWKTRFHSR